MCFEVPALVPAGSPNVNKSKSGGNDADDDLGLMDPDGNDLKPGTFSCNDKFAFYGLMLMLHFLCDNPSCKSCM